MIHSYEVVENGSNDSEEKKKKKSYFDVKVKECARAPKNLKMKNWIYYLMKIHAKNLKSCGSH